MNPSSKRIFRFGDVEVDLSRGCVRRGGQELHLRQQTFQVLIYLLENRERLVTKDELLESIWRETAVTDDALVQCVTDIRRAIGDDSRHPRFIKTLPKVGYRFVSPVEEHRSQPATTIETAEATSIAVEIAEESNNHDQPAFPLALPAATRPRAPRFAALIGVAVVLVAAMISLAVYLRHKLAGNTKPIAEVSVSQVPGKKPVAVMYFDNQSGSGDLDWLREGLADMIITDLSRSEKLSLLSRQQLHLLLERIGHNENEKIRLDEALDVARRSQARIVILGSFARLGEQIRIDVQLHDVRDGQLLAAERLVVDQPAQILTQVDLLSLRLASHLGATSAGPEAGTGLTSVTTDNLEAYRYYSLAVEKAQGLQSAEAVALLQKAISLDPQFAMAYARIGYVYGVTENEPDRAKPYLQKGFQLSHRLTERDKLYIAAWYAIVNLDYSAAINSFRQIISNYPLEVEAYWRLARLLQAEQRYEEALEIAKQGLVIDAGAKDLYNELGGTYLDLGRHDEAIVMYRRYVELAPEEPNAHDSLGLGFQWAGRYPEAIAEYDRALALKPDFEIAVIHLGNAYFQQGHYRDAIKQYQHYLQSAASDNDRARAWRSIARVYWNEGKLADAERAAKEEAKYYKTAVEVLLLLALERRDRAAGEKFEQVIESRQRADRGGRASTREAFFYRGYVDLKSDRTAEAIEKFRQALKQRPLIWDIDPLEDCLANAYLELGRFDEAIAEYERILRLNPNYPLVHYHLAQAYERKGFRDQTRAEYERFLQIWKDADADIPEVVSARKALSG